MNSTEKNSLLRQAICCAGNYGKKVADLLLANNKCAESEFEKLALLTSAIEILDCYEAPLEVEDCVTTTGDPLTDPIESIFTITIPVPTEIEPVTLMVFTATGTTNGFVVSANTDVVDNDLFNNFTNFIVPLIPAGFTVTLNNSIYTITGPCDITAYTLDYFPAGSMESAQINGVQTTIGICNETSLTCTTTTTEYTNCLTEAEADNIAEIITDICDICDCNNN